MRVPKGAIREGEQGPHPQFENFHSGGWGSVRGFDQGSIGSLGVHITKDNNRKKGNAIGGNLNIYSNIDILFPFPGLRDSQNIRSGIFFDMGNVYNTYKIPKNIFWPDSTSPNFPSFSNLRYSIGVQCQWLSPVGPITFSLAKPFNVKKNDSIQEFQFTLGQVF